MKHIVVVLSIVVIALVALAPQARAGSYGMAGCGLGSMLFGPGGEGKDMINDNKVKEILAATTNGTFMSQTFGITTGTSNCTQGGVAIKEKEQELFAEVNFDDLSRDMAQGQGEYLTAFGTLMGCSAEAQPRFAERSQANFEAIYGEQTTPSQVVESVRQMLRDDATLLQSCSRI